MEILKHLAEAARTRPEELKRRKREGTRLVGYTGRFVPEELIYASGALPYLLCRGGEPDPPEAALPYMLRVISPYARAQIGYHLLGLDPVIPMLDLIIAECSDCHMARLADLFEYFELPTARLGVPPDWEKTISFDYYHRQLVQLKNRLEALTGNEITDEKLREATESVNHIRSKLSAINELRKKQPPPIGGYDFILLNHYSFYGDLGEIAENLDALYQQLQTAESSFSANAPRILLAGRVVTIGDYVLPKLIETSGAVVVSEFLDEGTRQCPWEVEVNGDLLRNIAEMYYSGRTPPSIFQPSWEQRIAYLKELIENYNIDGVIWYQLSFDEIYNMECSVVAKAMEQIKMPFLKLESSYEYSREAMGPLTTRVESFIEALKGRRSNKNGRY